MKRLFTGTLLAAVTALCCFLVFAGLKNVSEKREEALQEIDRTFAKIEYLIEWTPDFDLAAENLRFWELKSLDRAQLAGRVEETLRLLETIQTKILNTCGIIPLEDASKLRIFSPNGFRLFYDSIVYDRTENIAGGSITGDEAADRRIRTMAEARGYRMRTSADETMLKAVDSQLLQPEAAAAWAALKEAAAADGIRLELVSGFRSVERQRAIFAGRLADEAVEKIGRRYTSSQIASGQADGLIESILSTSSIPGYSKHHTGYTIDINDSGAGMKFTNFAAAPGFAWMSGKNYYNAKRFGFIPSYPEGADSQGPDPESWEYVWVGCERLSASAAE